MTFTCDNFFRLVKALRSHIDNLKDVEAKAAFCGFRCTHDFLQASAPRYIAVAIHRHYMKERSEKIFIQLPRRYYPVVLNTRSDIQGFINKYIKLYQQ